MPSAPRKTWYRLPAGRRAELVNELRLRMLLTNKMLCRRYGVSLSTLKRLQAEAFERPLARNGPTSVRVLLLTRNGPQAQKPTRAA